MSLKTSASVIAACLLTLSACTKSPEAPVAVPDKPAPFKSSASIQELMQAIIDPSADALWESVSSTTTTKGVVDKLPQTDAEWIELRHLAIRLSEGAYLLTVAGRPVAHPGKVLEDSHIKGILTAPEIQTKIDAAPTVFNTFAEALNLAAREALSAIDQKNADAFLDAGGKIDQACENCHQAYWYPNDKRPTSVPDGAPLNPGALPAAKH